MELLLNLAWLLLVLPAYGIWRQGAVAKRPNRFHSLQGLLALGCLLVLLFPIISATDDLHAMRAEMEEPGGASKRSVRQASQDKFSVKVSRLHNSPAILENASAFALSCDSRRESVITSSSPLTAPPILCAGRAPPIFSLA
jgi:hypothetical protein